MRDIYQLLTLSGRVDAGQGRAQPLRVLYSCSDLKRMYLFIFYWTDFSRVLCMRYYLSILAVVLLSCEPRPVLVKTAPVTDTVIVRQTDSTLPQKVVAFAQTLIGTPYNYACCAPSTGFDCSGFINYVFHHFDIEVPRSSVDFTNVGTEVALEKTQPGDLILFTGTNSKAKAVGHIGLIVSNDISGISFIHSSSGIEQSVIITRLNDRYMNRFVKVIRLMK